ncbi:glucose 1-dehydrogenase [Pelagibius litoralis]|uniref:Glucose 1-dehydrogenase n=1 Tax=Pelagibius litoralis TaxID=374515 RepID=A0A967CAQ0_9PROT|nr:glucose 1-dehydrogenase [Pelagibius litoralis]NIA67828.1 glucose 1-dehydrogenase [Pelagibius litoralis]
MQAFDLSGKVALVTGGNGGIGLGIARGLAKAGAALAIVGRSPEKLAAATAELERLAAKGAKVMGLACDVSDEAAVAAMVEEIAAGLGRLDILVNNAGTNIRKRPEDLAADEWHRVMDANLTSTFLCSKACYPQMKAAGGGKILNNGSMLSIFGAPWSPAYGASKGGVVQLTRSLAAAWARDNIQVNCMLPGWIDTDLTQRARSEIEGLNEHVLQRTPAKRWGRPADFEGLAAFFAGPASDFITGAALPVDGGFSISL